MIDFTIYNLNNPIDISIPLRSSSENVTAWYVGPPEIKAVENGEWIGDVNRGGSVNFRSIFFNPHGHGTHTECVGHISKAFYSVNQCLKTFFFSAILVTIEPELINKDLVITKSQIERILNLKKYDALIIRTLPNDSSKLSRQYSHSNFPYVDAQAMDLVREAGVKHFLIDLPSVDKEEDGGLLAAHKSFWNYPANVRLDSTITEFIFVPELVEDGEYLLNLQIAPFENDASPSKPILYPLK